MITTSGTKKIAKDILVRRIKDTGMRAISSLVATQGRSWTCLTNRPNQYLRSTASPPIGIMLESNCRKHLFSSIRRSSPLSMMAKLEILSLGNVNDTVTSGIVARVMPVDSMVRAGDVVATLILPPKIQTISKEEENNDDSKEGTEEPQVEEIPIYAPQTGRIKEVYYNIRDPISIGDSLMDIDDTETQADRKGLEEQLRKLTQQQQPGQSQTLPEDYMETLMQMEDAFRLQNILQLFPAPLERQALPLYERLLELQKDDAEELAKTHTMIGVALYKLGDLEMTLQHLHKALDLRKQALGAKHPQVAATCIHLGALYRNAGDFESSLKHMQEALEIQRESLGDNHPIVASSYNNIGALYYQLNDFPRAIREYEKALAIHTENKNGEEMNTDTAGTYHNLGVAWKHLGDFTTAQEYLLKALHIRQEQHKHEKQQQSDGSPLPPNSSAAYDVAVSHTALGQLYAEMVNYEASMEQYEAALALQEKIYGPDSPITATSHNNIGAVHYEKGEYDDALQVYQKGLDILRSKESNHPDTASSWNNVGLTYLKLGDFSKAMEHHIEARRILTTLFGPTHPNLATTIGSIGNVYKAQEEWEKALEEYKVAHELLAVALGTSEHPDVASSYNNMGLVLSNLPGREQEALEAYKKASAGFEASLGSEHPHVGSCRFNMGLMLQSQGEKKKAMKEFDTAREIWTTHFGPDHVHTQAAQKGIEECS